MFFKPFNLGILNLFTEALSTVAEHVYLLILKSNWSLKFSILIFYVLFICRSIAATNPPGTQKAFSPLTTIIKKRRHQKIQPIGRVGNRGWDIARK